MTPTRQAEYIAGWLGWSSMFITYDFVAAICEPISRSLAFYTGIAGWLVSLCVVQTAEQNSVLQETKCIKKSRAQEWAAPASIKGI